MNSYGQERWEAFEDLSGRIGRGAPGPVQVDFGEFDKPDLEASAYRKAIRRIDYRDLGDYVSWSIKSHDDAMGGEYSRWRENRAMRHDDLPAEDDERTFEVASPPDHRLNAKIPVARYHVEGHINMVLAHEFRVRAEGASGELRDSLVAEKADMLIRHHQIIDPPEVLRRTALEYAVDCSGLAFGMAYFDSRAGAFQGYADGEVPAYEGMARIDCPPTYQMCWDPNARHRGRDGTDDLGWVARRQRMTRVQLQRVLTPEELRMVDMSMRSQVDRDRDESLWDLDNPHEAMRRAAGGWDVGRGTGRSYELVQFFQRRDDEYPFGLYAIVVNGLCLRGGPAAFAHLDEEGGLDIPFSVYCHLPAVGRLPGVSLTGLIRDLQEILESSETSRHERDRVAAYLTFLTSGAGQVEGMWVTEHANFVNVPRGGTIDPLDIKPSNHNDFAGSDRAKMHMADITGLHDISRGAGGSNKTATEVDVLSDADQLHARSKVLPLNRWQESLELKRLKIVRGTYNTPRLLRISGDHNAPRTRYFVGSDLNGIEDVRFYSNTALPAGPSARVGRAAQLAAAWVAAVGPGVPMLKPDEFHELMGFDPGEFGEGSAVNELGMRWALTALETGAPSEFSPHHDHEALYRVFRRVLHSAEFERAAPEGRAALEFMLDRARTAILQQTLELAAPPPTTDQPAAGDALNGDVEPTRMTA